MRKSMAIEKKHIRALIKRKKKRTLMRDCALIPCFENHKVTFSMFFFSQYCIFDSMHLLRNLNLQVCKEALVEE